MPTQIELNLGEVEQIFQELQWGPVAYFVGAANVAAARVILREAKREIPVGPTGNLKRSLKVKGRPGYVNGVKIPGYRAYVFYDQKIAPHRHFLELGTYKQQARPVLEPAAARTRTQQLDAFVRIASKRIVKLGDDLRKGTVSPTLKRLASVSS